MIFCKTSLRIKVNCIFLHKITGLVQNLPKATISPSTTKKLNLRDFALPLAFSFIFIKLLNKSDVSSSRNNSHQNAAIQENLKLIFFNIKDMKGDIKSIIDSYWFFSERKNTPKSSQKILTDAVDWCILPLRKLVWYFLFFSEHCRICSTATQPFLESSRNPPQVGGALRDDTSPPSHPLPLLTRATQIRQLLAFRAHY